MTATVSANQQARALLGDRPTGGPDRPVSDATAQAQAWATIAFAEALGQVAEQLAMSRLAARR